ncbi:MAG: selenium metabolism-associated LysR family transcriptional regulator [Deltaproteobacteria bacterium]|nr:selenium metabolism-associated LysR family transcriptional regulator [Deltaproteobacteria bacterium]
MTLKQLEVFVAIAESRSFSRGAENNCITQSTASQHIHGLEEELGIRLFDRGRGGALLTEAGKLFFEHAQKILSECEDTRSVIRRFVGMEDVVLRVGASNIPGTWLIPDVLGRFVGQFPKVRLEVLQGDSHSVLDQLIKEEIELGFIGGYFEDERIEFKPMGRDTIIFAASTELIALRNHDLEREDLCRVPLLVREDGSGTQKAVYEALSKTWTVNKENLNIVAVLGSSEAIRRALLKGTGYAFISSMSISDDLANGRLFEFNIPGLEITRHFYAARRHARDLSPAAAEFWSIMTASEQQSK